jgi:hypothetical protein
VYTIDVDSTICEVYGWRKQGAAFGHTGVRGYHPLLAFGAGTGDLRGARLRGGNANSGRGAGSFVTETINRIRAAGATGQLTLRADSGFTAHPVVKPASGPACATGSPPDSPRRCAARSSRSPMMAGRRSATGWTAALLWPRPATGRSASEDPTCG